MARRLEGDDDRRLERAGQERLEAERPHAGDEHAAILGVAPAAAFDAVLGPEFLERLVEGGDDLDRRGETVLAGLLEGLVLVVEVEYEGCGVALRRGKRLPAGEHEAEAGHAFDAFVGRGRDRVEGDLAGI